MSLLTKLERQREAVRRYRQTPGGKIIVRKMARKYYHANKEKCKKRNREWYAKNHLLVRDRYYKTIRNCELKRKYGITNEEYNLMLVRQGNGCAICGKVSADWRRPSLKVDHCHKSGVVRGLLCTRCNLALGFIEDKVWFDKARRYLQWQFSA